MTITLNPPNLSSIDSRDWLIVVTLIGAALLTSIAVEVYKRHYSAKKQQELEKHWVAVWLTLSSAFFTYLSYIIFLGSTGSGLLSGLPYVGKHIETVVGIATSLYLLKNNTVFKQITAWATNFTSDKPKPGPVTVSISAPPLAPPITIVDHTAQEDTFSIPN